MKNEIIKDLENDIKEGRLQSKRDLANELYVGYNVPQDKKKAFKLCFECYQECLERGRLYRDLLERCKQLLGIMIVDFENIGELKKYLEIMIEISEKKIKMINKKKNKQQLKIIL